MWIHPIAPEDLAYPKQCADCGAAIVWAKNQKGLPVAVNAGFKVLETLEYGEDGYLHLLPSEAAHNPTCRKKAAVMPALTRKRRKRNVGV